MTIRRLLDETASYAADFLEGIPERQVTWSADVDELRASLGGPLPDAPADPREVIAHLAAAADPGLVAIPSGRYFGFVIGGAVPAAVAADWLSSAWDQNAGLYVGGPSAAVVEEIAGAWTAELLGLPDGVSFGFVTGCQMAHVTALAAARHAVLDRVGWDVNEDGLIGAPRIHVVAGEERHTTIDRALRFLGLGTACLVPVPADGQGRMLPGRAARDARRGSRGRRSCARRPATSTRARSTRSRRSPTRRETAGAWFHVDGAFGLWAAASPALRHLVAGVERADSWATDAHKWLNVPYDCGIVFCAHPDAHRAAMSVRASYLIHAEPGGPRDQMDWNPEFSRRARGFPVYAAIRSLGRAGIAELVERCCAHARRFGEELGAAPGVEVLNDVVLNQVLVRFGDDETHRRGDRGGAGRRHLLARRHDLARHRRDADLGLELVHERRGRRALDRRDPQGCRDRLTAPDGRVDHARGAGSRPQAPARPRLRDGAHRRGPLRLQRRRLEGDPRLGPLLAPPDGGSLDGRVPGSPRRAPRRSSAPPARAPRRAARSSPRSARSGSRRCSCSTSSRSTGCRSGSRSCSSTRRRCSSRSGPASSCTSR